MSEGKLTKMEEQMEILFWILVGLFALNFIVWLSYVIMCLITNEEKYISRMIVSIIMLNVFNVAIQTVIFLQSRR